MPAPLNPGTKSRSNPPNMSVSLVSLEKLAFLPNSGLLLSGGGDGWIRVWCPTRGILLHREHAG